jgi:uncharacterized protein YfdQ (DUF2303 family)
MADHEKVERFAVNPAMLNEAGMHGAMSQTVEGGWVRYEDYAAQRQAREEAEKRERRLGERADAAWKRTGELLRERSDQMKSFMREEATHDLDQLEAAADELGPAIQRAEKAELALAQERERLKSDEAADTLARLLWPAHFEPASGFGHQQFAEEDREERREARQNAKQILAALFSTLNPSEGEPSVSGGCRIPPRAVDEAVEQGGEDCKRCGRGNAVWSAASPLWNAVIRGGSIDGDSQYDDMVCATCFMQLAEEQGIATKFRVTAEEASVELETTTPSGRVWDEQRFLWVDGEKQPDPEPEERDQRLGFDLAGEALRDGRTVRAKLSLGRGHIQVSKQAVALREVDVDQDYVVVSPCGQYIALDLEILQEAPVRPRGVYKPSDVASFIDYVETHQDEAKTTIWVHPTKGEVVAVLDDNAATETAWREHRAVLVLAHSAEWDLWLHRDGNLMDQTAFAEHLREGMPDVKIPDGATLLEIAESFESTTGVHFRSKVDFNSGERKFKYDETVDAKATTAADGEIAVPRQFTLSLAPFLGEEPVEIVANLRHDARGAALKLGYKLERPERAVEDALERVADRLSDRFKRVYRGTPA